MSAKQPRKKYNTKPTQLQIRAVEILMENSGTGQPIPVSRAMIQAGYDEATAKNPKALTDSKGFNLLLERLGVDDNKLATVLKEGLDSMEYVITKTVSGVGKDRFEETYAKPVPDHSTRHRYLETGLRLKGLGKSGDTNINFYQLSREIKNEFSVPDAV